LCTFVSRSPKTTLALLATAALFGLTGCRAAGVTSAPDPEQGLTVTGSGEAIGVPDEARLSLGVREHRSDAAAATAAASKRTEAIIAALIKAGVARSDIQTRQVSVHENYRYEPRPMPTDGVEPEPRREYVASNMLQVRVVDLDAIGEILGAATNAGVNQMHGIELRVGDPDSLEQKALDEAMADARAKAERLAASGGVELGDIVAIRVNGSGGGHPMAMSASGMDMAESSVPVERGEITIQQSVWVKYAIE